MAKKATVTKAKAKAVEALHGSETILETPDPNKVWGFTPKSSAERWAEGEPSPTDGGDWVEKLLGDEEMKELLLIEASTPKVVNLRAPYHPKSGLGEFVDPETGEKKLRLIAGERSVFDAVYNIGVENPIAQKLINFWVESVWVEYPDEETRFRLGFDDKKPKEKRVMMHFLNAVNRRHLVGVENA